MIPTIPSSREAEQNPQPIRNTILNIPGNHAGRSSPPKKAKLAAEKKAMAEIPPMYRVRSEIRNG